MSPLFFTLNLFINSLLVIFGLQYFFSSTIVSLCFVSELVLLDSDFYWIIAWDSHEVVLCWIMVSPRLSYVFVFVVPVIKFKALCMLGQFSNAKLYLQPLFGMCFVNLGTWVFSVQDILLAQCLRSLLDVFRDFVVSGQTCIMQSICFRILGYTFGHQMDDFCCALFYLFGFWTTVALGLLLAVCSEITPVRGLSGGTSSKAKNVLPMLA